MQTSQANSSRKEVIIASFIWPAGFANAEISKNPKDNPRRKQFHEKDAD